MGKIVSTLLTVIIAVGVSAALWVGANLMFNQVRHHWTRFSGLLGGCGGFVIGVLLSGNRITVGSVGGFLNWVWLPLLLTAAGVAIGVLLAGTHDPGRRLLIGLASGTIIGASIGLLTRDTYWPAFDIGPFVICLAVGCALGAGIQLLRGHSVLNGLLVGAAAGWIWGAWGTADLGAGSMFEALLAAAIPGALLGMRLGRTSNPDLRGRAAIDTGSRAYIFLTPALLFIIATLVVPTIRTIYLSFFDRNSVEFVKFDNYIATFTDPGTWDASNWTNFFSSRLFYIGAGLLIIALITGVRMRRTTGRAVELGNATAAPLIAGGLFVAFALFTVIRGTISNNLWWAITVTVASTGLGLAAAVLADGRRGESVAKSIIFMPMAISMVGASIIWRFMYQSREVSQDQTGVMNAVWVGLGRLSTGSGLPTFLVGVTVAVVLVILATVIARALVRQTYGAAVAPVVAFVLLGWFFLRYITSGVGGYEVVNGVTRGKTIFFLQEIPFNSVWLMVILIWIQTGFAMVILSAAIKAVPEELIEAARIDGASTSQIFWRVTLPQIGTTIGVVVTTLIVLVMKVFDIVKVTTNGQFDTQVLANDMYNRAFSNFDIGRGASLAVILFLSVLPVMYLNIRRSQKAEA